jgi:REP element-mobilizing transposase RayT
MFCLPAAVSAGNRCSKSGNALSENPLLPSAHSGLAILFPVGNGRIVFTEQRTVEQAFHACVKGPALNWALAPEVPMTIPYRGATRDGTYFITASNFEKQSLLQSCRMANLFLEGLFHYQKKIKYNLHEFVIMPDHFHLLITPIPPVILEKAVQFIKGAFSYRAKKELAFKGISGRPVFTIAGSAMRMNMLASGTIST